MKLIRGRQNVREAIKATGQTGAFLGDVREAESGCNAASRRLETRRQVRRSDQDQKDDLFLETRRDVEEEAGTSPFSIDVGESLVRKLRSVGVPQKLAGILTAGNLGLVSQFSGEKNTAELATELLTQAMKSNTEALLRLQGQPQKVEVTNQSQTQRPQVRTEPADARLGRAPRVEPSF